MSNKVVTFGDIPSKKSGGKKKKLFRRGKSLLGPLPSCTFGPKATTHPDFARDYVLDPDNSRLTWSRPPENVLIIKRTGQETDDSFKEISSWLLEKKKLNVFIEKKLQQAEFLTEDEKYSPVYNQLQWFAPEKGVCFKGSNNIDLIITIGGDGTFLYAASLFQHSMPPLIAFRSGSLGFLTTHPLTNFQITIDSVLEGNALLMLRSRLRCRVLRSTDEMPEAKVNGPNLLSFFPSTNSDSDEDELKKSYLVLNEVVVNRGTSQYLCNLDLFLEERQITSVQGDGLIISTPTGSTAYAVAAGASMVHPDVPSIVIAPICPHSLSFRPIIVPSGVELKFRLSKNARGPAWVSFDGSYSTELKQGDLVSIRTSVHPAPCVCRNNAFDDWFDSLSSCLHWNERKTQKSLESEDA